MCLFYLHTHITNTLHFHTHTWPYYIDCPATFFLLFCHVDQDKPIYHHLPNLGCFWMSPIANNSAKDILVYEHFCRISRDDFFSFWKMPHLQYNFFSFWKILPNWSQKWLERFIEPPTLSTINVYNSCTRLQGKDKHIFVVLSCISLVTWLGTNTFSCLGFIWITSYWTCIDYSLQF